MSATKYRIDRRAALGLLGGTAATLFAVPGARVNAQTLDKISHQTNWRAQAEHGGYYYAAVNGIYRKHGLECDVRLTADQIPVCMHDATARRMAGVPRAISAMTLAELRELDFGAHGPVGMTASRADRGIFTLEQFCELAVDSGQPLVLALEVKHPSRFAGAVERQAVEALDRFGLLGRDSRGVLTPQSERVHVRLMSLSQTALERCSRLAPNLERVFLTDSGPLSWPWGRHLPGGAAIAGPSVRMLRGQPDLVRSWQQSGHRVHVWTANEPADVAACVDARVDAIITDRPAETLALVQDLARPRSA